jgi:hypothetical protein
MSNEKRWFVRVGRGDPVGPVTRDQLIRGTQAGKIPFDAVVCAEGATTWTPLHELGELNPGGGAPGADARRWFVRAAGVAELGPFTTAKLLRSIEAGGVTRDAEVREQGASTWLPVGKTSRNCSPRFRTCELQPTPQRQPGPCRFLMG